MAIKDVEIEQAVLFFQVANENNNKVIISHNMLIIYHNMLIILLPLFEENFTRPS